MSVSLRLIQGLKVSLLLILYFQYIYSCNPQLNEKQNQLDIGNPFGNFNIHTYIFRIQQNADGRSGSGLPPKKAAWHDASSITSNILLGMAIVASLILGSITIKKCCAICNDVSDQQVHPVARTGRGNTGALSVSTVSSEYGLKTLKAFEELPPPTYEECMKNMLFQKRMDPEKIVIHDC
ncbi:unnamed protein product [Orchesella dallaii]|uniref:Uncharacterized protein n=1 Tax=Orchesella dallaii TaxID=48710 RepID=A0ABP1S908_9HEXA